MLCEGGSDGWQRSRRPVRGTRRAAPEGAGGHDRPTVVQVISKALADDGGPVRLAEVIGSLEPDAADRFTRWCRAELAVRSDGSEFAFYVGRYSALGRDESHHELLVDFDELDLSGDDAVAEVKALIASVWECCFDDWSEHHPGMPVEAARAAATREQRAVIAAVWTQLAEESGASPAAAAVAAVIGPDWPDDQGWAGLLTAAEAASR